MKFRIILMVYILSLAMLACNISGGGGKEDPPPEEPDTEILINGKNWFDYYTEDSKDSTWVSSTIGFFGTQCDSISFGGEGFINYQSYRYEGFNFRFIVPRDFNFSELDTMKVDYHLAKHRLEKAVFSEIDYDKILGSWNRYDTFAPAWAKITTFDYEVGWMEAEFDVTLILDEEHMQSNNARRRADTLHITGKMGVEINDRREEATWCYEEE